MEHLKKIKMRKYLSRIVIPRGLIDLSTGELGEKLFEYWFTMMYQQEKIFKQKADRDYEKIDFADEKGYTYQIKATRQKTFTFNCKLENLSNHCNADYYVFIQIKENVAYIEHIHTKEYVLTNAKPSFKEEYQCFIYATDLLQQTLF